MQKLAAAGRQLDDDVGAAGSSAAEFLDTAPLWAL